MRTVAFQDVALQGSHRLIFRPGFRFESRRGTDDAWSCIHAAAHGVACKKWAPGRQVKGARMAEPLVNVEIAQRLKETARLLEEQGANPFRV